MSMFTVGDFVTPRKGVAFRSGSSQYDRAIVVSVLPWVIVSEEGDMVWTSTISAHDCLPAGHATQQEGKKAFARWERDKGERLANLPTGIRGPGGPSEVASVTAVFRAERLVCAAEVVHSSEALLTFTAVHHYQIHRMMAATGVTERGVQGFMTNLGRFVGRKEGRLIAERQGQVVKRLYDSDHDLYSEEMWSLPQVDFDAMDAGQSPDAALHNLKLYRAELDRMRKVCDEARAEVLKAKSLCAEAKEEVTKLRLYDQVQIDAAVREVLHTVGVGATRYTEDDYAMAAAVVKRHMCGGDGIREIDLDQGDWREIKKAASEAKWMPAEYMKNDWVSDVCNFLREGPKS